MFIVVVEHKDFSEMSFLKNIGIMLQSNSRQLFMITCSLIITVFSWLQPGIMGSMVANAAMINQSSTVVAIEGIKDQVEGKVKEDIGTVKRNVGKVTGQAEGKTEQLQGKAQQSLGEAKNKLDNAQDNLEDTSENVLDSVKDFFSN